MGLHKKQVDLVPVLLLKLMFKHEYITNEQKHNHTI